MNAKRKPIAQRVYERSQHITVKRMREVRIGKYRIVNGVVLEQDGEVVEVDEHRVVVSK